jgi:leucyl aminopeptidase (aminopeptidase T)
MIDLYSARLAQLLADYSVQVRKGDLAIITGDEHAMPLYNEFLSHVFRAGGYPGYYI